MVYLVIVFLQPIVNNEIGWFGHAYNLKVSSAAMSKDARKYAEKLVKMKAFI